MALLSLHCAVKKLLTRPNIVRLSKDYIISFYIFLLFICILCFFTIYYNNKSSVAVWLLKALKARLHRQHFSLFRWTLVPVSSVPIFPPVTRTSAVVRTARVPCFPCRWTQWRDFLTLSTRTRSCGGSSRRSVKWTGSQSSDRGASLNRTTSQSRRRDEIGHGPGADGRSWNSFGWRIKIWFSGYESRPTSWRSWNRSGRVFWWRSNCFRTTWRSRRNDVIKTPQVLPTSDVHR